MTVQLPMTIAVRDTVVEDSPGNITLSATDIDIGDNLTYTLVSSPVYGNVTIMNNQILFLL